jgi:formylglycine-generating enzyme required for sulfatase activity
MSYELASRLRKLRDLHEADVVDDDTYQAGLAKLRGQYGADAVDALLRQGTAMAETGSHTQHIGGFANIAAAIAGDFTGNLYIIGERAQSAAQALAGYLRWLASQCGQLPLSGVHERKGVTDVLHIHLAQVYTQLATKELIERERFEGETLKTFNAQAYLEQHVNEQVLPGEQRTQVWRRVTPDEPFYGVINRSFADAQPHSFQEERKIFVPVSLSSRAADILTEVTQSTTHLVFEGPQLVTEAIATSPRLVLLGEPGSGKSTALRYLALTLAQAGLDQTIALDARLEGWGLLGQDGKLIPLFMPLLPLAKRLAAQPGRKGAATDLWAAIDAHLDGHGATPDVRAILRAELQNGHVLLLLDGLDEVAGGQSRHQVVQAVQAFAAEQPQCRMVVACRVRAYEGEQNAAWQLPGWPTATLADWIPGQVHAFIGAWYRAAAAASEMPAPKRDERIALLQSAVTERADLKRLSIRPLLLTIIALVHLNDGRLSEDRVSLYARCLDLLLGQWEITGKDETVYGTLMQYIGLPDTDIKSLRLLLTRAAYLAHGATAPGEVGLLRRADLHQLVADALHQLKHPNPYDGAKRFLEYTDVRAGLIQAAAAGDAYSFPHQTFQEYLAGLELVRDVAFVQRIMEKRADDRWHGPILLGVGHLVSEGALAMPHQLLTELLAGDERAPAQAQRDVLLAAEIAADVGWERLLTGGDSFKKLRRDLAGALAQVVEGTALPAADRMRAGVYLGALDDPRFGVCMLPPAMVRIKSGEFIIGNTRTEVERIIAREKDRDFALNLRSWLEHDINEQSVHIADFEIARYSVTNAQYALFIADNGYDFEMPWWSDIDQTWSYSEKMSKEFELHIQRKRQPEFWGDKRVGNSYSNHPVVGVSWYEAMAFCAWLTQHKTFNPTKAIYRLPSEAEWEFAARGAERRPYPWGNEEPDNERANFDMPYNGTMAVGCYQRGATPNKIHDLAGNVWEWTNSIHAPYSTMSGDRTNLTTEALLVVRGGSWLDRAVYLRAAHRRRFAPELRVDHVGFRLVRQDGI